jgi:hypothetical protein
MLSIIAAFPDAELNEFEPRATANNLATPLFSWRLTA